jgi:hypothetical protein
VFTLRYAQTAEVWVLGDIFGLNENRGVSTVKIRRLAAGSGMDLNFRAPSSRPSCGGQPHFHFFGTSGRARPREIIVERRVPPHYGLLENPGLTIEGHADMTGLASVTKKYGQFIARGIGDHGTRRLNRSVSRGSNPVRSTSQAGSLRPQSGVCCLYSRVTPAQ